MVYYYTSKNVKLIRSLMLDYRTLNEISPLEYMKTYFESFPQDTNDSKISWTIESFLGIHKHSQFIKQILIRLAGELSEENKDYFTIIFHAMIFQMSPKDMTSLYKCMFNLGKVLLETFLKTLSNIDNLPLISQIAEAEYDKAFVIENIKSPLFSWHPFISEMNKTYKEHINKIETRKLKMPTIPVNMNVLNRTGKPNLKDTIQNVEVNVDILPYIMPDKRPEMLTNSKISKTLNNIREKNKLKALNLYTSVKNNKLHYTQVRCIEKNTDVKEEVMKVKNKRIITVTNSQNASPQIKSTVATMKRISERIKKCEQAEMKWVEDVVAGAGNVLKLEELLNFDRQEKERQRLFDIERKHLMGQISYEEAVIAKKKLLCENKRKYEEFIEEKKLWDKGIEEWKLKELERNQTLVEKLSLIELEVANSRNNMTLKRKEMAERIRQDTKKNKETALKNKQAELERRADMIKEIKILSMIAKKSKMPKIIDLTESSGLGLLCEMSIAELQERLIAMKISLTEELDEKRNKIKTSHLEKQQDLEETKKSIDDYMSERAKLRKETKSKIETDLPLRKEICELKNTLMERRNQRIMLTK